LDTKKPHYGLFFVSAVAAGVNADGRELPALSPAFDSKRRNAQNFSYFANSEKIGPVVTERHTIGFRD
jgi:hypothetical protein